MKPFELKLRFALFLILLFATTLNGMEDETSRLFYSSNEINHHEILRGEQNLKRLGIKIADDIYQKNMFSVMDNSLSSTQNIRNIFESKKYLHPSNPFITSNQLMKDKETVRSIQHSLVENDDFHILLKCRNVESPILIKSSMEENLLKSGKVSHLSLNVFSMRATLENIQELILNENIEWIGKIDPIFKFHMDEFENQELAMHKIVENNQESNENSDQSFTPEKIDFISINILLERNQNVEKVSEKLRDFAQWINNGKQNAAGRVYISKIVEHSETITMIIRKEHALAIAYEISKLSSVLWIEPLHTNYEMNKYSKRITNYGLETTPEQDKPYFNGLTGKDEVVTVVDGTFDTMSCFFYDPNVPVEQIKSLNESNINLSSNHRKIKMHFGLIDNNSNDFDHGTHVAGSVAGFSSIPELYDYRGIASDAKLALVQLGCANPDGCTCDMVPGCACNNYANSTCPSKKGTIYQPTEPHKTIHYFTYEMMKSRIQTNSWGGGTYYSLYAMHTDEYIWNHKDFIVLFSAGNSGNNGFKTIGAQAQSKNGLAVGASHNSFQARREHELIFKQPPTLDDVRREILSTINCNLLPVECEFFRSDFNVCSTEGFCAKSNASYSTGNCGCTAGSSGDKFCGRCVFDSLNVRGLQIDSMASFSSRGPTPDLRIKPDVNAPGGDILSARSYSSTKYSKRLTCSDTYKSPVDAVKGTRGTSMATPTTASLVSLVRQYYREGYYPSKKKNTSDGFIPSSALLKASIINSGTDLKTVSNDYLTYFKIVPRSEVGCFYQGFGRVQLDRVLAFEDSRRNLQIGRLSHIQNRENRFNPLVGSSNVTTEFGDPVIDSVKSYHYYYLKASSEKSKIFNVKITLVWADYPGSPASSSQLINDLDLLVQTGSQQFYGNSQLKGNSDGSTPGERDFRNNVEQVWIDETNAPGIVIKISASYIFKPQSYALVVTGENIELEPSSIITPDQSLSHSSIGPQLSLIVLILFAMLLFICY